jgi:quercetin dioxygenase-like cupin family protein
MVLYRHRKERAEGAPEHSHPQELRTILLKGEAEAYFNGQKSILKPRNGYYYQPP